MIFLDIDMGDVNGIALARQIRTIRKDAAVCQRILPQKPSQPRRLLV